MTEATVLTAVAPANCPPWCAYPDDCEAATAPIPDDRRHFSATVVVPLSLEPTVRDLRVGPDGPEEYDTREAQELCARLGQHTADAEPVLELFTGEGAPTCLSAGLTLGEAESFARGILALVDEARRS